MITPIDWETISFLSWLISDCGYRGVRPIGDGRYAAVRDFLYTSAIIVGKIGDDAGFDDSWCYHSFQEAMAALDAWDFKGEPTGWHRHPASGRRRNEGGEEYVNP